MSKKLRRRSVQQPGRNGSFVKNPLQNIKYHFVITTSLVTRYCVTGGMEAEQAYRLSDFYILRADACTDVASVVALHHAMVLDYTGKMALRKRPISYRSQFPAAWITSMTTSTSASLYRRFRNIPGCQSAIFPACSSRILASPSAITSGRKNRKGPESSALLGCQPDRYRQLSGVFFPEPFHSGV